MRSIIRVLVLTVCIIVLNGCSKSSSDNQVTVAFPDWSQLQKSTYQKQSALSTPTASSDNKKISILTVTVNGSPVAGMPWNADQNKNQTPPMSAKFTAMPGDLVQVLAVFDGGGTQFFYGDANVPDKAGDVSLEITITNVIASAVPQGRIIGRYVSGSDAAGVPFGPKGTFNYRFTAPGKPAMTVATSEIFNGWINATTLGGHVLSYAWADGSLVFDATADGPELFADAAAAASNGRSARIVIPPSYKNDNGSSSTSYNMKSVSSSLATVGFFGPGVTAAALKSGLGFRLCYAKQLNYSGAPTVNNLYTTLGGSVSAAPSGPVKWAGGVDPTTLSDSQKASAVYVDKILGSVGGVDAAGDSICQSPNFYAHALNFDYNKIANDDEMMSFKGPFIQDASGNYVQATVSGGTLHATWMPLPGVEEMLGGMSVMWRQRPSGASDDSLKIIDGFDCASMRKGSVGGDFEGFKEVQAPVSGPADFSIPTGLTADNVQLVVCPRGKDGTLFKSAARVNNGGGSNSSGSATQLAAYSALGATSLSAAPGADIPVGVCYPVSIKALASSGTQGYLASGLTNLNFTVTSGSANFYPTPSCNTGAFSNSWTMANFFGNNRAYLKASTSFQMTVADASGSLTSTQFFGNSVAAGTPTLLKVFAGSPLNAYTCQEIDFHIVSSSGLQASPVASTTFPLPATGWTYFNDPNCQNATGLSTVSFLPPQSEARLWAVYSGTLSGAQTYSVSASTVGDNLSTGSTPITIVQPGAPSRLSFININNVNPAQSCAPVAISLLDANNSPTPVTTSTTTTSSALSISLSADNGGKFYSDYTCGSGSQISTTSIALGSTTTPNNSLYFKANSSGVVNLSSSGLNFASGLTVTAASMAMTLNPVAASQLVVVAPGQTFSQGVGVIGTASTLLDSVNYSFAVYAITSSYFIADGTNGTVAYNAGRTLSVNSPLTLDPSTSAVNFMNGATTILLKVNSSAAGTSVAVQPMAAASGADSTNFASVAYVPIAPAAPTQMVLYGSQGSATTVCQPVLMTFEDSNGASSVLPSSLTVAANFYTTSASTAVTAGKLGLSGDSGCATNVSSGNLSGIVISSGSRYALMYYNFAATSTGRQIAFTGALYPGFIMNLNIVSSATPATTLRIDGNVAPKVGTCTPFMISTVDTNGSSAAASAGDLTLSLSASTSGMYHALPDCSDASITSTTLLQAARAKVVFVKTPSTAAVNLNISSTPILGANVTLGLVPHN